VAAVSPFQRIALLAVGLLAALSLHAGGRRPGNRGTVALWLALWCSAALALLRPDLTQRVAGAVGIRRGADLVFYCAVLAMLGGFFVVSLRLRQHSRELTLLVRHLALRDAPGPRDPGTQDEPDDARDARG
jgi:small membrane protein